jgi:hypothetical protein
VGAATPAASGAGITFPATASASSDANTLDDYEEGTWTPTASFSTPGNVNVVYSTRVGSYTKIGNFVKIIGIISTTTFTHSTASGIFQISGLPFTALGGNGNYYNGSVTISNWSIGAGYSYILVNLDSGYLGTTMYVQSSGASVSQANLSTTSLPSGTNLTIRFELSYMSA